MWALWMLACSAPAPTPPERVPGSLRAGGAVVFRAGDLVMTEGPLELMLSGSSLDQRRQLEASGRIHQFYEQVALGELAYQRAIAAGLHRDPQVVGRLALEERQFLGAEQLRREAAAQVSEGRVDERLVRDASRYQQTQLRLRLLVVPDEALAQQLAARLRAGEAFGPLAEANSTDASKVTGGQLGWMQARQLLPELRAPLSQARVGELIGPVQGAPGWHLALVEAIRERVPEEEARAAARAQLEREALERITQELRAGIQVQVGP
jgi:hypothetical protein